MLKRLKESLGWRSFSWAQARMKLPSGLILPLANRGDFEIVSEIFLAGTYASFLRETGPVRTWVDLGCNAGYFTLWVEHIARIENWEGERRAVGIDANSEAVAMARKAVELNCLGSQYTILMGAAAEKGKTSVVFYEGKSTHKSSLHPFGSRAKKVTRPTIDLEEASAPLGAEFDLIKIDIEGAEGMVVEHWSSWLCRAKHLIIEWHRSQVEPAELSASLEKLGFRLRHVHDGKGVQADIPKAFQSEFGTGLWSR